MGENAESIHDDIRTVSQILIDLLSTTHRLRITAVSDSKHGSRRIIIYMYNKRVVRECRMGNKNKNQIGVWSSNVSDSQSRVNSGCERVPACVAEDQKSDGNSNRHWVFFSPPIRSIVVLLYL